MDFDNSISNQGIDDTNASTDGNIQLSIDEFTLVLQPRQRVPIELWKDTAEDLIHEFQRLSQIEILFETMESTNFQLVQGYNTGYKLAERPFYLCICYHDYNEDMGVCCKFSATAYRYYKKEYFRLFGKVMNLALFLQSVESGLYVSRLSRVDFVADYFNVINPIYKDGYLDPHTIYQCLNNHTMAVVDHNSRNNIKTTSGLNINGTYETVYIGSRKGNTSGFMRIYDKREEQIQNHGDYYSLALSCASWCRFEAVYKRPYSHQIGEVLKNNTLITSDNDLACFIAGKMTDKYVFVNPANGDAYDFSQKLIDIASGQPYDALECLSPRDNSLEQSLEYLIFHSGLMITLAKARFLYPDCDAEKTILDWLYEKYQDIYLDIITNNPKHEVYKWLRKHSKTMQEQSLDELLEAVDIDIEADKEWYKRANFTY